MIILLNTCQKNLYWMGMQINQKKIMQVLCLYEGSQLILAGEVYITCVKLKSVFPL